MVYVSIIFENCGYEGGWENRKAKKNKKGKEQHTPILMLTAYVCIELAHEAREVVVLEEAGEEAAGELVEVPDDEAVEGGAPGDNGVGEGVVDHLVGLGDEGGGVEIEGGGMRLHGHGREGVQGLQSCVCRGPEQESEESGSEEEESENQKKKKGSDLSVFVSSALLCCLLLQGAED
jgi:hypothetical protein